MIRGAVVLFAMTVFADICVAEEKLSKEAINVKRYDPHGSASIVLKSSMVGIMGDCLTCHSYSEKKGVGLKFVNPNEACRSCHQRLPHSGLVNHLGKEFTSRVGTRSKIDCLTCHRAHRARLPQQVTFRPNLKPHKPSKLLLRNGTLDLPPEFIEQWLPDAMVERDCNDCHKWENLP